MNIIKRIDITILDTNGETIRYQGTTEPLSFQEILIKTLTLETIVKY